MLTTGRRSRLRLTVGAATVGMLTLGGLAATASGTAAAASVRARVETATGLDLSSESSGGQQVRPVAAPVDPVAVANVSEPEDAVDPASPQDVPETVPPAPAAPPVPPAPTADPYAGVPGTVVVTTNKQGKKVVKHVRYVRVKDGKTLTEDYRDIADAPDVRSADCSVSGNDQRLVVNGEANGKKFVLICNDRIRKIQVDAQNRAKAAVMVAVNSRQIERQVKLSVLTSLRASRASMAASFNGVGRDAALSGIDQAIRNIENQMDSND